MKDDDWLWNGVWLAMDVGGSGPGGADHRRAAQVPAFMIYLLTQL